MQDIMNRADAGRKIMPDEYDLSMTEFLALVHMGESMNADGLYKPITAAYFAGFEAGMRYSREGATA